VTEHQRYCEANCRKRDAETGEDFKEKRRLYMKKYRSGEVKLEARAKQLAEQILKREKQTSIFRRGNVYWYHFLFNREHIQKSTKHGNPRTARQMEAAHRTALAKGEVGIEERKAAPMFSVVAKRFLAQVMARP
jgi:hypothetical protein